MLPALTAIATLLAMSHHIQAGYHAVTIQQQAPLEAANVDENAPEGLAREDLVQVPDTVEVTPAIVQAEKPSPPLDAYQIEAEEVETGASIVEGTSAQPVVNPSEGQLEPVETDVLLAPQPIDLASELAEAPQGLSPRGSLDASVQADLLSRAEASLGAARTAKGEFEQLNADGSFVTGEFALRRPGRVRLDYADPSPILIVSDGTTVAMQDSDLETVDRVPLGSTPLGLILDDDLDFGSETIEVINVSEEIGLVAVTVRDATGEVDGELTLLFEADAFDLLGWIATDAELQTTQVSLNNVETNARLDPRLFRLDDPSDEEDER